MREAKMVEQPRQMTNPDGSVSWDLGFGITHTVSADNYAKLQAGLKLAKETGPDFKAKIEKKTIPQLKELCRQAGRSTRGFGFKQNYVDALMSWYTSQCLKQAGYVDSRR